MPSHPRARRGVRRRTCRRPICASPTSHGQALLLRGEPAQGWQLTGGVSAGALWTAVPFLRPLPVRQDVWLVPLLFVWSVVAYTLLMPVATGIRQTLFAWWPASLALAGLQHPRQYPPALIWLVIALSSVLNVVGPIVEELYFRGYLLPRLTSLGRWAPLNSVALFSLHHVWLPWEFFSRVAALLPAVYMTWRRQNVFIAMWVHALLNSTGSIGLLILVLSQR